MAIATALKTASKPPPSRTRIGRFTNSTVGLKLIMAVTGVVLSGFVLGHMAGNLKVFEGAEALNAYGRLLRFEMAFLWGARLTLLTAVALHIFAYLKLTRDSLAARPVGYRKTSYRESSYASRTMRISGPLLLGFIIFHLLHLTTGTVHPSYEEGDVYHNVVSGLRAAPVAVFYLLAMTALGFHLWHGIWSLFQTLGAGQPRYNSLGRHVATVFTLVVVLGFSAVPLAVLARIVK